MTTYYSRHNMPGVPRQTGYTGSYGTSTSRGSTRQRASSLSRENSATRSYTPSKPPRPLPHGPGPLDSYGRKIDGTNYKIKTTSTSGLLSNGPLKATNNYASTYTSSYSSSYGTGISSGTSSRPSSSLKNRRSTSISNISDTLSDVRLTDSDSRRIRNREESNGLSSYRSSQDEYTPRGSKTKLDNDDIFNSSRTSSRNSRLLKDNNSFDESYTPSMSRKRDASLPPMSRRDSSPLDSRPSLTGQNSISPINANGSLSQHVNGGKVGLRNLGNTCFMNSVLQCLSNTKPLVEYFLRDDFTFDKNTTTSSMKGQLVTAYANLMKSMWNERSDSQVSPNSFKTQIQRFAPRFMGYAQQDAQEFLRYLLEGLHEDVNKVTSKPKHVTIQDEDFSNDQDKAKEYWRVYLTYDNSHIVEIFVGQLKSELRFDCDHRSVTFDPFWDLSVPIPKTRSDVSIIQCLTAFMKAEVLDGDERPTCSKCKKRMRCTKSFSIQRFPTILVLHLKRFSQGRYSQKVSTCVDFPEVLDMTEYSSEKGGKRVLYSLYGVSNHSGGVHSGHYTANGKHPYSGEWHVFNDTRVSPTSASRAVSAEAYLLFYERVTDPSRL